MGEPIECPCCGGKAGDSDREYTDGDPVECGCDGIFSVDRESFGVSVYDCPCQDHDALREHWVGTLARERAAMKRIAALKAELADAESECARLRTECPMHGDQEHGAEATELRQGIEKLISECDIDEGVDPDRLQELLDEVDARDALAFVERVCVPLQQEIERLKSYVRNPNW